MEKMELLSPAGSMSALKQAVFNGADSVYLGIKQFNARNNIEGFNLESLKEAVEFAHIFNVKVYLAINILFKDEELLDAVNILAKANNIGVDAFIIQDLGLCKIVHETYPNIILHASTQLAVHNLEGVIQAQKLGFKRVVLARETPLKEIKRIKQNSDIELEFFGQGALCVSFSGNCYMCSHLKNKSGNRGECLQFCRLKYELLNEKQLLNKGYLLSAKDICMLNNLKSLHEAGISCLKIEGRARRNYYLATATKLYRMAIDNKTLSQTDFDDLNLAFNRNFVPAYLNGNDKIISKIQGHNGINIGTVKKVNKGKKFNEIFIETKYQLQSRSVLKFVNKDEEIASISAVDVTKQGNIYKVTTTNSNIVEGCNVHILSDEIKESAALSIVKKRPVKINITAKENEKICLTCHVNDTVYQYTGDILNSAKNAPINIDDFEKSFSKSEYFEPIIQAQIGNVFLAKSQINEIRRICYDNLYNQICRDYLTRQNIKKVKEIDSLPNIKKISCNIKMPIVIDTKSQIGNSQISNSDIVIYDPSNYQLGEIESIKNKLPVGAKLYLNLPNFATSEDIKILKEIVNALKIGIVANNIYSLEFNEPKIAGGFLNIYNSFTVNFLQEQGIDILYAKELNQNEIENISKKTGALILKDKKHFMTLRHCPIKHFIGGNCESCKFKDGLIYKMQDGTKFKLTRKKVKTCTFYLEEP